MKIGSNTHRKRPLLCSALVEEKPEKQKGRFKGSFHLICSKTPPILALLFKPKSKPLSISAPLSLPKSKPPHRVQPPYLQRLGCHGRLVASNAAVSGITLKLRPRCRSPDCCLIVGAIPSRHLRNTLLRSFGTPSSTTVVTGTYGRSSIPAARIPYS